MVLVFPEEFARERDELRHSLIGDSVVDRAVLAASFDEAAPAQAGEMVGNVRLSDAEPLDEPVHGELTVVGQGRQDPQSDRIGEYAEVLG